MLAPNTILQNRYRIVRELGHGGMGTVYEALDQRVNCIVALKETLATRDSEARKAFEREAALLANLRHQALPKVMDYFSENEGDFLVMEFIPGYDLAELLESRESPFPQSQVLRWADELLKVLEYLHKQDPPILHRDIKPSNLKLTKQGEIFLLDFGLAKGSLGQMATLATSRSVRGYTPVYASLEQIHGHGTDARSDIYSLGATLYHLLTGAAPVDAATRFHFVEDDQPDPLPPIDTLNSQSSQNVAEVIHRAMAISRKQRIVSTADMRKALRYAAEEDERSGAEEEYRRAEQKRREREEEKRRAAEEAAVGSEADLRATEAATRKQEEEARGQEAERRLQVEVAQRREERTADEVKNRAEERLRGEAEEREKEQQPDAGDRDQVLTTVPSPTVRAQESLGAVETMYTPQPERILYDQLPPSANQRYQSRPRLSPTSNRIRLWWIIGGVASLLVLGIFLVEINRQPSSADDGSLLGRPLLVGILTRPGYAGGIVANNGFKPNTECIYFKNHKQTVEFVLMEDPAVRDQWFAMGEGGVDIVWSTVDCWANELPGFISNGLKARAILQVDWSRGGDAIVADESIKSIDDLKGKKISLVKYTPSHWLLEYHLENSGLSDYDQKQIIDNLVGKDATLDARQAFKDKQVDATVVWGPDVTRALQRPGSHILVSTETASNLIADIMVAREDFIREHPDVIKAFIEGWLDGTSEAVRNPDKVVQLLMENEPLYGDMKDQKKVKDSLSTVKYADLADNTKMFGLDGSKPLFDEIFAMAGAAWVLRGYITSQIPPDQAKDITFLKEIYASAPVPRASEATSSPKPR